MRIECPHCRNRLNLVDVEAPEQADSATCPSCGSVIPALELTVSHRHEPSEMIGHFELINQVGVGQFGTVWRARDTVLKRTVAVKLPRDSELDVKQRGMFLREARAAAKLNHEGIVRTLEVGEHEGRPFIVSDFINGITLADRIRAERISVRESADLLRQVALAVQHAHENQVIHRDLKPGNILISVDGQPYVSDFGLARQDAAEVTMTVTGMILGTPAYMSPEQAAGFGNRADARSDVYSLGVVLYELLTGDKPFHGSTAVLLHEIQSKDPRTPRSIERSIPRDLETVCLKTLEKNPDRRYQSAQELADDLQRYLKGEAIHARRVGPAERLIRKARRNRIATVSILASILVMAVSAFVVNQQAAEARKREGTAPVEVEREWSVTIHTKPAGARVVCFPRDTYTGEPIPHKAIRPAGTSPVTMKMSPGDYLVVAVLEDGRFHEVFRHVPEDPALTPEWYPHRRWVRGKEGTISLPVITIPDHDVTLGMILLEGSPAFPIGLEGDSEVPRQERRIAAFHMDGTEFTFRQTMQLMDGGLPPSLAPKTTLASANPDHPVTGLFYDEAVTLAEAAGKRLPGEFEFEFAARPVPRWDYPFGPALPQGVPFEGLWIQNPVVADTFDRTPTEPAIQGLFSSASEFTSSRAVPYDSGYRVDSRSTGTAIVVRGGPVSDEYDRERMEAITTRSRIGMHMKMLSPRVGFRCVRSRSPRLTPGDF